MGGENVLKGVSYYRPNKTAKINLLDLSVENIPGILTQLFHIAIIFNSSRAASGKMVLERKELFTFLLRDRLTELSIHLYT